MASWRNALLFHPSRLFRGCRSLPRTRLAYWKPRASLDRKSTRLNSSHSQISYAVFCLKKKKELQLELRGPPGDLDLPAGNAFLARPERGSRPVLVQRAQPHSRYHTAAPSPCGIFVWSL